MAARLSPSEKWNEVKIISQVEAPATGQGSASTGERRRRDERPVITAKEGTGPPSPEPSKRATEHPTARTSTSEA